MHLPELLSAEYKRKGIAHIVRKLHPSADKLLLMCKCADAVPTVIRIKQENTVFPVCL